MPKGTEKRDRDRKQPKLTLMEKRLRKREKKYHKEHPVVDARDVFEG